MFKEFIKLRNTENNCDNKIIQIFFKNNIASLPLNCINCKKNLQKNSKISIIFELAFILVILGSIFCVLSAREMK